MAKKNFGKMVVFAALTGAAIGAGLYYFKKYKSFDAELEEEFLDIEGEDEEKKDFQSDETETKDVENEEQKESTTEAGSMETVETTEIESEEDSKDTVTEDEKDNTETEEESSSEASDAKRKYISLNVNADELKAAAKDKFEAARHALKDGAAIVSGMVHDAAPAVKDKMQTLKENVSGKIETYKHAKDNEVSDDSDIDLFKDEDVEETSVPVEETASEDSSAQAAGKEGTEEETPADELSQETKKDEAEPEPSDIRKPEDTINITENQKE